MKKKYLRLATIFGVRLVMEMNIVVCGIKTNMVRRHGVCLYVQREVVCLHEGKCDLGELYVCMVFICDVPVQMNVVNYVQQCMVVYR